LRAFVRVCSRVSVGFLVGLFLSAAAPLILSAFAWRPEVMRRRQKRRD
jgi:hypothetical protein